MNPSDLSSHLNRRRFLTRTGQGIGGLALASLLDPDSALAKSAYQAVAPKAKRIIYLFQSGGPPHHDLFDHKPHLVKVHG